MKIAAVVVLIALPILISIVLLTASIQNRAKDKDKAQAHPLDSRKRKLRTIFAYSSYIIAFIASICGLISILSGNNTAIWAVIVPILVWLIMTIFTVYSYSRHPFPQEALLPGKVGLDAYNKWADKGLRLYFKFLILPILILIIILIIFGIAVGITSLLS